MALSLKKKKKLDGGFFEKMKEKEETILDPFHQKEKKGREKKKKRKNGKNPSLGKMINFFEKKKEKRLSGQNGSFFLGWKALPKSQAIVQAIDIPSLGHLPLHSFLLSHIPYFIEQKRKALVGPWKKQKKIKSNI